MKNVTSQLVFLCLALISIIPLNAKVQVREFGHLRTEDIPEIPRRISDRFQRYHQVRSASLRDWDPAGTGILISTRFGDTTQLHFVEKPGGARHQITFFDEPAGSATMCPDPSRRGFLFTRDVGGGEFYQVFYYDRDTGESTLLTDGSSRHGFVKWSNKGDRYVYSGTQRNGRDWDIFLADINKPGKARPILERGGGANWSAVDWSPDDSRLLIRQYISTNESNFYVLEIGSGELVQINPSLEKISYGRSNALWDRDGNGIFLVSDEGSEFLRLKYYDIATEKFTELTADIPWDVSEIVLSAKGDKLAFTINEDGIGKLYLLDTDSWKYEQVPGLPLGQIFSLKFHRDGLRLALVLNTPSNPSDVYVLNLPDNSLVRWTYSETGGLPADSFAVPELIHFETFDKVGGHPRKIPAFYYRPSRGEGPYPILVNIHGGPASQTVPRFSSAISYYVNELGIAVISPNVRGSKGYGKSYLLLDNGFKREDSVKDIGKLLDWIAQQPELNAERVAVVGGSYGGYMVLASMVHFNDRLRCGIERYGISNFVTFLENTQSYRRDRRRKEYGDERDPKMRKFLEGIAPAAHSKKITRPMLIAQGLNDPRVPPSESEQMVAAIRNNGGEVWYMLADNEGHGFKKKSNREYYNHAMALFLEKYLLK